MAKKSIKKRNWACVFYPESLPSDWLDRLREKGLKFAVSPLHDKDLNPDGEIKKAHYHLIFIFEGPTSFNVVNSICEEFTQPHPQALESVRGAYRYFTHKDNPEKYQYDDSDVRCYNGFDIRDYVELTKTEVNKIIRELQDIIIKCEFYEYCDFMDYLFTCGDEYADRFDVASSHTYYFDRYISSRRNKKFGTKK